MADRVDERLLQRLRETQARQAPQAWPSRPRRPLRRRRRARPNQARVRRGRPKRAVADGHHRARTAEGKLYLCAIKDVYSGRIVGYSIDSRMKSRLAFQALEDAVAMRSDVAGCIVHSDRGSQFRSRKMLRAVARHRMVGSMGRVGSSADNAAMETLFVLLQKNVLNRRSWNTREQLRIAMVTWIERTYHRRRSQARLGRLTPIEFETIMNTTVAVAA